MKKKQGIIHGKLLSLILVIAATTMVLTSVHAQRAGSPPEQAGSPQGSGPGGPGGMPFMTRAEITNPAVYIKDGAYSAMDSAAAAVSGGKVGDTSASGITITSDADNFNGIYVTGDKSQYTLSNSTIEFHGIGGDISGPGAGAFTDSGVLTLKNVNITTYGAVRTTAIASGTGSLKVYDSTLTAHGGDLPEDYLAGKSKKMMECPPMLLITGNCRTICALGTGRAYLYNSTFIADGWGALSTDAGSDVYLEANNCTVQVNNSGYGTYADNNCKVVINDTKFSTATYTAIISGNGVINFNNITEDTALNCVMIHAPGTDFLRVANFGIKGGRIATKEATILVKSANADIILEGAELLPRNGVLIESLIDNNKRSALLRWLLDSDKRTAPETGQVTGINATLKDMTLEGDIIHADTTRPMSLSLVGTTLKGSITGSVWTITDVSLSLDRASKWTATADSKVKLVGDVDVKSLDAPEGVTITAYAGEGCTLEGTHELASGGTLNMAILRGNYKLASGDAPDPNRAFMLANSG